MLDEIAFILFATLVLAVSHCERPHRAQCPPNWRHDGIGIAHTGFRDRGEFSCNYYPYSETARDPVLYSYQLRGRIWCAETETPVQTGDDSVACRSVR